MGNGLQSPSTADGTPGNCLPRGPACLDHAEAEWPQCLLIHGDKKLSFDEIRQIIRRGSTLCSDKELPLLREAPQSVPMLAEGAEPAACPGDADCKVPPLPRSQSAAPMLRLEMTGMASEDMSGNGAVEVGGEAHSRDAESPASCWSLESELPLRLQEAVIQDAAEALHQSRSRDWASLGTKPGAGSVFQGFIEVGTLESELPSPSPSLPASPRA